MINLLSYDNKRYIRAARTNVTLVKCLIFLICAIIFMAIYCLVTFNYLKATKSTTASNNRPSSLANDVDSSQAISQSISLKTNLTSAKLILNKRISYSDILSELATILPSGVVLNSLSISNTSISKPITINLRAISSEKNQEITKNVSQSSMFSSFLVKSVTENKEDTTGYKFSISATIIIKKAYK